jgi:uncharacterized membrane protein YgaE (UPF0421/DUF939 family)
MSYQNILNDILKKAKKQSFFSSSLGSSKQKAGLEKIKARVEKSSDSEIKKYFYPNINTTLQIMELSLIVDDELDKIFQSHSFENSSWNIRGLLKYLLEYFNKTLN